MKENLLNRGYNSYVQKKIKWTSSKNIKIIAIVLLIVLILAMLSMNFWLIYKFMNVIEANSVLF